MVFNLFNAADQKTPNTIIAHYVFRFILEKTLKIQEKNKEKSFCLLAKQSQGVKTFLVFTLLYILRAPATCSKSLKK